MKKCERTGIYYLSDYEKYRDEFWNKNPAFNKLTGGYILDVKNNKHEDLSKWLKRVRQSIFRINKYYKKIV